MRVQNTRYNLSHVEFVEFLFDFYLFYFSKKHLFIVYHLSKVPIPER